MMDQPMHLELRCNPDVAKATATEFLRSRLYIVRTLIPPGYEAYFRKRARYRSVHTSTAIEGNKLDEQQAMLVLVEDGQATTPDEIEVKNLDEAYELIQQIAGDRGMRVDEGLVRTMNSIILKGLATIEARSRGQYRLGTSLIVNSQTRAVRYRPPPPEWVAPLMEGFLADLQRWISEDVYPGPIVAALAHFGLISIHPFADGNGRTARLLADMILQKTGWSNEGMLSVSEAILKEQQGYYDVLRATQGEDFVLDVDATRFIKFHTKVLNRAAGLLEETAINFNRRREEFASVARGAMNPRQALAFMFMMDVAPLSSSAYAELTGASQSSAFSDLAGMVGLGVVERIGQGRNTRYRANSALKQSLVENVPAASVEVPDEELEEESELALQLPLV